MGKHSYGVVLDAGSSGTRVYVYQYKTAQHVRAKGDSHQLGSLPEIKTHKKWNKKVHPGISTFGEKPELVGTDHLRELVEFAQGIVPRSDARNTPIFLLATAGMRLLPDSQRMAVLEKTCSYFRQSTEFLLPDCDQHIQVIPGETEGLYGWIAANYLLGGFDAPQAHNHGKGHSTYGFLDMGGASAQIAFAPNATEAAKHANDLKLLRLRKVNGQPSEYRVFVTTWLGFGANEARRRYVQSLLDAYPNSQELPDPCLPKGLLVQQSGEELAAGSHELLAKEPHLIGTGVFAECLKQTYPLLEKDHVCEDSPCLLNGVHTPAIDFDVNHFVGVSEYWHTTHEVFAMAHKDKAYDFATYQKQVTSFCSRNWRDIADDVKTQKWGKKVDEKTVEEVCFKASWLINMLHDGIGVPRIGIEPIHGSIGGPINSTKDVIASAKHRGFLDPFQAVDEIDGTEVSWTLGKMLLYASSQMPPANDTSAVGFGSNQPGVKIPSDFQFASGNHALPPPEQEEMDQDWHDRILSGNYSRRIPGVVIFLVILALAVYLLCGRERRTAVLSKVFGSGSGASRSKRRKLPSLLPSKFFGASEPSYERVLEDAALADFELADIDSEGRRSDSSSPHDAPRTGRSSGWATPVTRAMSPDFTRTSPKNKGYLDGASSGGNGVAHFDRGGLIGRTESKERLAPKDTSRRSRTGSPNRRSPLMTPFKESVD